MKEFLFGENMLRIGGKTYDSSIFGKKLRTQIMKNDYRLGNLILRFPNELICQMIFRYDSLKYNFREADCSVEITNRRIRIREEAKIFIYDEELGKNLH
jgi:hypothetical protein